MKRLLLRTTMLRKAIAPALMSLLTLNASWPATGLPHLGNAAYAQQTPPPPPAGAPADPAQASVLYGPEQLDALLAPIALYPDQLLTQVLIASSFPLEVVEAARWVEDPRNKALQGPALESALQPLTWDPSVKSLVPFPTVLAMMNSKLDWMQQVGYAFSVQQQDVLDSVQRLRAQAQAAGNLQTTQQQVVRREAQTIIIEPAQPQVVYVPAYNPTVVYGTWAYPAYPPVYIPPPPSYYVGNALLAGIAFGAGVAVVGGLWGWCRPSWGSRNVYVNHTVYNNITVNNYHRTTIVNNSWQGNGRPWGGYNRPPTGPVGAPARVPPPNWRPPGPPGGNFTPSVHPTAASVRPGQAGGQGYRPPPPPGISRPNTLPPPTVTRPSTAPQTRPRPQTSTHQTSTRPASTRPTSQGGSSRPSTRPSPAPDYQRPSPRPDYQRPESRPMPQVTTPRPAPETMNRPAPSARPQPMERPQSMARPAPSARPESMARPAPRPEPMARPAAAPRPRPN